MAEASSVDPPSRDDRVAAADRRQVLIPPSVTSIVPTAPSSGPSPSSGSGAPSARSKTLILPNRLPQYTRCIGSEMREPVALPGRGSRAMSVDQRTRCRRVRSAISRSSPDAITTPERPTAMATCAEDAGHGHARRDGRGCRIDHVDAIIEAPDEETIRASNASAAAEESRSSATGVSPTISAHPPVRRRHHRHCAIAGVRERRCIDPSAFTASAPVPAWTRVGSAMRAARSRSKTTRSDCGDVPYHATPAACVSAGHSTAPIRPSALSSTSARGPRRSRRARTRGPGTAARRRSRHPARRPRRSS